MSDGARVLIVDDEELVRMVACDMLEELGFSVIEATTAEEALAILRIEKIDILFTDYGLPGQNGAQLAEMVSREYPTVQIIFASGYELDEDRVAAEVLRRSRQVSKPYSMEALTACFLIGDH